MLPVGAGGSAGSSVRRIKHALHAELGGRERGRARVVRLLAAARDHVRGVLGLRLGEQILELSDLVARELAAGVVVALDPDLRTLDGVAQPVTARREVREADARWFDIEQLLEHGENNATSAARVISMIVKLLVLCALARSSACVGEAAPQEEAGAGRGQRGRYAEEEASQGLAARPPPGRPSPATPS